MKTLLALDIGTSSTRARLYRADDAASVPGAASSRTHSPDATHDGASTLAPERIVEEALLCCAEAVERAPQGTQVLGVGVSTFWHSVVGIDDAGAAQTPVLLWSDRRSASQVARLKSERPTLPESTGCPWHTSYALGRLHWLAETRPDVFARCSRFLSPAAYLQGRLFGWDAATESTSMASASGLFDQRSQTWLPDFVAKLPEISGQPRSGSSLLPPALRDVPWFPALGDGGASNLGCGATSPESLALMVGTSGAIRAVQTRPAAPPPLPDGLWRYQLAPEFFVLGGALTNGGSVWEWLQETLAPAGLADSALASQAPDAHGLTVLPFLAGERAPLWRDDLTGAVVGLTAATTAAEIARASLESVGYRFAAVREKLRPVAPHARLIGTGKGLIASPLWCQILADIFQEEIHLSGEEEASSRGAALWAREGLGLGRVEDVPPPDILRVFSPNATHAAAYAAGRARHEALRETLAP